MSTDLDRRWSAAIRRHAEGAEGAEPTPEAWAAIVERAGEDAPDPAVPVPARRPWVLPAAAAAALVVVLGLVAVLAAGTDQDGGVRAGAPATTEPAALPSPETPVRVEAVATVLESDEHGPEACFGGVQESLPPQCTGLPLVGWDWAAVEGEESAGGTTWGTFRITGDYTGEQLAVTAAADSDGAPIEEDPTPDPDLSTPCPEPAGGWTVRDPALLTDDQLGVVQASVEADPQYGILWFDDSVPIGGGNLRGVLNVSFTGDLESHRSELEAIWGGPLCVTAADVSGDDLQRASHEVLPADGSEPPLVVDGFALRIRGVSSGNAEQVLRITVDFAPPGAEAALTERLGVPVRLSPVLHPVG